MDFYPFKQIIITIKSYSLRSKAFKVSIPLGTSKVLVKKQWVYVKHYIHKIINQCV